MSRYILIGFEARNARALDLNPERSTCAPGEAIVLSESAYERLCKFQLRYPRTPGAEPYIHALAIDLASATDYKAELLARRRDLRASDVRVELRASDRCVA